MSGRRGVAGWVVGAVGALALGAGCGGSEGTDANGQPVLVEAEQTLTAEELTQFADAQLVGLAETYPFATADLQRPESLEDVEALRHRALLGSTPQNVLTHGIPIQDLLLEYAQSRNHEVVTHGPRPLERASTMQTLEASARYEVELHEIYERKLLKP